MFTISPKRGRQIRQGTQVPNPCVKVAGAACWDTRIGFLRQAQACRGTADDSMWDARRDAHGISYACVSAVLATLRWRGIWVRQTPLRVRSAWR